MGRSIGRRYSSKKPLARNKKTLYVYQCERWLCVFFFGLSQGFCCWNKSLRQVSGSHPALVG